MDHQGVRLLDHLRATGPLASQQQVGRDRAAGGELGDHQRLQPTETGELLVDPRVGVVAVDQGVGEPDPAPSLAVVVPPVRADGLGRAPQVPPRHDVGEGVVVHGLVVLVGSDDPVDVGAAVRFGPDP